MKKIFILFLILSPLFLSACAPKADIVAVEPEKTPFMIDIFTVWEGQLFSTVEKSGRITAKSSLTLSSRGVGEIWSIAVKEWSAVKAGAIIARLKDTLTNYDLQLAQAENTLKIQNASRETTRINLDQGVQNNRIAYERAQQTYDSLKNRTTLQYDLTVSGNKKTLDTYNENFRGYITELEKSMTQLLYEGDKILGITTVFQYSNDSWESYLGARIGNIKVEADNKWNALYSMRGELRARIEKWTEINRENPDADIALIAWWYNDLRSFVDTMLYMLQNNVIGGGLPQVLQDGWMLSWNGYRSQVGWAEAGYNAWKSQTVTFFKNYKDTETATKLAIAILDRPLTADEVNLLNSNPELKITYENTRIDLQERTKNAELTLEQSKLSYASAQSLKDSTLTQLAGSIDSAAISLELARRNAENLVVRAPVAGTISKVLANVWQSVATGNPIVEFTSNEPEIAIDIEPNLARTLSITDTVDIDVDWQKYIGTIVALSSVSGKNLLSSLRISVSDGTKLIGKTATILFTPKSPIDGEAVVSVPLEAVRIIAENEWEIRYYSGGIIERKSISISALRSGLIETRDVIDPTLQIIVTDTTNYDSERHILTLEK